MITIRLSMNGESPITLSVTGSRSGAPGIAVSSVMPTSTASAPHIAQRSPRLSASGEISSSSSIAQPSPWSAGSHSPSLGSTIRAVINVSTIATKMVEPMPK